MTSLPNFGTAVIPPEKLTEYALSPDHPEGKHKAKLFRDFLGIRLHHAQSLAALIQGTLSKAPAEQVETDEYGVRWVTYHEIVGLNGEVAIVTVAWIFPSNSKDVPRLVSCYIEPDRQEDLRRRFFSPK